MDHRTRARPARPEAVALPRPVAVAVLDNQDADLVDVLWALEVTDGR